MFKRRSVAAIATAAILVLAGCSAGSTNQGGTSDDSQGGTLTWGTLVAATTFAQKNLGWTNESPYAQAIYDSLLRLSPDGEIEPNLATEWTYNDTRTVLTLTLRDDVEFSNGELLTAEDAAASLLAYKGGTSAFASNLTNLTDATAVDDTTLEITLAAPDPAMLHFLTQAAGMVAPVEHIDDEKMATDPIGSGPYLLDTEKTVPGSSYVFEKNEEYWAPEDQHYDELIIQVYADTTALLNAVQGGQLNVSATLDASTTGQMESAGYTLNTSEIDWSGFLLSDREGSIAPALADVRVRQAINYALDREALLQTLGAGFGTVTSQIFPTFSSSYIEELDSYYDYDVAKAKDLMAEAGYADGFDITMPSLQALPTGDALLADQLGQIGINVTYEPLAANDYISNLLAGKYAMTAFQLGMEPTDFQLAQSQIAATATWNVAHVSTPEVDSLVETIQTGDEAAAEAAGKDLNRYLVENAWFAPAYRVQTVFVSDASTEVELQLGNPVPYLWNVQPK